MVGKKFVQASVLFFLIYLPGSMGLYFTRTESLKGYLEYSMIEQVVFVWIGLFIIWIIFEIVVKQEKK